MDLLITLLVALIVGSVMYWIGKTIIGLLPMEAPAKGIATALLLLIILILFLGYTFGGYGPHWRALGPHYRP